MTAEYRVPAGGAIELARTRDTLDGRPPRLYGPRMRPILLASAALLLLAPASPLAAQNPAFIVQADPPHDPKNPAHSEILHIPSGGVKINGLAYIAAGAGPHPTVVLLHGLPGNEKNLDLAQAIRRSGWNAITFNYRGSWGSPGVFRFANVLQDVSAVLAYVRDTTNARKLGVDPRRIVLAGHSMGGWATALTGAHDHALLGVAFISMADMGRFGSHPRSEVVAVMADDMETLADVTAESMTDEIMAGAPKWRTIGAAAGLARVPMLMVTSDDDRAPQADSLVTAVRALGNTRVTTAHIATDHVYSDKRISLQIKVLGWLKALADSSRAGSHQH